jgi:hypothetical protein
VRARLIPTLIGTTVLVSLALVSRAPAEAATITISYAAGHRDVTINGYGTPALGTFTLRDADEEMVALCVEADSSHTTIHDAYSLVPNRVSSPELDALLWMLGDGTALDADTATAAAALAWYYADAQRNIGVPVWADGTRAFARITPLSPEPWDTLARFSLAHPIGLRSGTADLDTAERRVVELHRQAAALAGPWTLSADAAGRRVRLTGSNGAIAGRQVTFTIVATGSAPVNVTATTDSDGWAMPSLPDLPDGASVAATISAPGVHREWDGAPGVQRMVTATTVTLTAGFEIAPSPRFVAVHKSSSDPAFAVGGAEFAVVGANGVVAAATTDSTGVATFPPIDPVATPGPYAVRELAAPPGLLAAADVPVPEPSHDSDQPTIVEIVDEPARVAVQVRKVLSEPTSAPDLAGFVFTVRRNDGGFEDEIVTGSDGLTDAVRLTLGDYEVCETVSPDWAFELVDGGCIHVAIALGDLSRTGPVVYQYLNIVPTTTTTTTAPAAVPTTAPAVVPDTTTTSIAVEASPPVPTTTTPAPPLPTAAPRPLPRTGGGAGRLLDLADIGFVAGVVLVAIAGLLPRRPQRETAGHEASR